jgi:hypothetical protein
VLLLGTPSGRRQRRSTCGNTLGARRGVVGDESNHCALRERAEADTLFSFFVFARSKYRGYETDGIEDWCMRYVSCRATGNMRDAL